jgi:hypothetical protein
MHWLRLVEEILESDEHDLRRLALLCRIDPKQFYAGVDLSKTDLRGQDLRGLDFTGSKLEGALIDEKTLIDPEFDPRRRALDILRICYLGPELLRLIEKYKSHQGYGTLEEAAEQLVADSGFFLLKNSINIDNLKIFLSSINSMDRLFREYDGIRIKIKVPTEIDGLNARFSDLVGANPDLTSLLLMGLLRWAQVDENDIRGDVLDRIYDRIGENNDPLRVRGRTETDNWYKGDRRTVEFLNVLVQSKKDSD